MTESNKSNGAPAPSAAPKLPPFLMKGSQRAFSKRLSDSATKALASAVDTANLPMPPRMSKNANPVATTMASRSKEAWADYRHDVRALKKEVATTQQNSAPFAHPTLQAMQSALAELEELGGDCEALAALAPPPGEASQRQLHAALRQDQERSEGECASAIEALTVGFDAFRFGGKIGISNRAGKICALQGAIAFLRWNLPTRHLETLEVLLAILDDYLDAERGISPAALTPTSGGNRHSQRATDLKARCIVMSEILHERGLDKKAADQMILKKVLKIATLLGLKVADTKGNLLKNTIGNWRADARRDARRHKGSTFAQAYGLSSLVDSTRNHLVSHGHDLPDEELLDFVLKIKPSISPAHLSHLVAD